MNGLKIGNKVGFEILARMMQSTGIDKVSQVMIDIMKNRPSVTKAFISSMCNYRSSEVLWEVLLDCTDKIARSNLARVIKFALCQLKMEEKEIALANEMEKITRKVTNDQGEEVDEEEFVPKAICIKFMTQMIGLLEKRAPIKWRNFDQFLEIFHDFMVYSVEEVELELEAYDKDSETYKVGVELYFKYEMIHYLGDFILQEKSPYHEPGQIRTQMGGSYISPNFGKILASIIIMISDKAMMTKYPLNELD